MTYLDPDHARLIRTSNRRWLVKAIVLAGVIAFGYFAVTLDTTQPGYSWISQVPGQPS